MKRYHPTLLFACAAASVLAAGCARFTTTQKDIRDGERTEVVTKVSAHTLFNSNSQLGNFSASQTDKTQGAKVGSLQQESRATTTNDVQTLREIRTILGR